jgi:hypothetical protein
MAMFFSRTERRAKQRAGIAQPTQSLAVTGGGFNELIVVDERYQLGRVILLGEPPVLQPVRVPVGRCFIWRSAREVLRAHGIALRTVLDRHATGDFGEYGRHEGRTDLSSPVASDNMNASRGRLPYITSLYRLPDGSAVEIHTGVGCLPLQTTITLHTS